MKPFDLQKALAGDHVVTKNGLPITEIVHLKSIGKLVAVVVFPLGKKKLLQVNPNGKVYSIEYSHSYDLFMASVKKKVFANVYKDPRSTRNFFGVNYDTKEEAQEKRDPSQNWLGIATIEWEENEQNEKLSAEENNLYMQMISQQSYTGYGVRAPARARECAEFAKTYAAQQVEHATAELRKELEDLNKKYRREVALCELYKARAAEAQCQRDEFVKLLRGVYWKANTDSEGFPQEPQYDDLLREHIEYLFKTNGISIVEPRNDNGQSATETKKES